MKKFAVVLAMALAAPSVAAGQSGPTVDEVMTRVGQYVASYGEKAAVVVATEKYSQSVLVDGADMGRPRDLIAEFAIVRVAGGGWTGYRDVIEASGKKVQDRKDRLVSLLTDTSGDVSELMRIANESARFNVGPITRNFNVPTAAMFFFMPADLDRFTFSKKGTRKIDGVETWEIAFKETRRPTRIMTRAGKDVPIEGTLHVKPDDGTVIRTRFKMRNFADMESAREQQAPEQRAAQSTTGPTGGLDAVRRSAMPDSISIDRMESEADIEVTYTKPDGIDVWFPSTMTELYVGPIKVKVTPVMARSTTRAKYSDFRQFNTAIKIVQ